MQNYRTTSHSVYDHKYHLVWITKYRNLHDGSEYEIGDGYWLVRLLADIELKRVIPLYLETYSQEAHNFKAKTVRHSKPSTP